jgi:integrase/recombinase XerD
MAESNRQQLIRQIVRLARRARLDYGGFQDVIRAVRRRLGLRQPARSRKLPHLLPKTILRKFYENVDASGNLQHQIMLRPLFYTAARVREMVGIRREDVDLDGHKIFIASGKGARDRYILFPD